jgi:hypothetical protein
VVLFVNFLKGIFKMKKLKKISFLFTLIAMFIISALNSKACPEGYTSSGVFPVTINENCTVNVEFCYTCSFTGPDPIQITNVSIQPQLGSNCPFNQDMFDKVLDKIIERYFQLCTLPPCDPEGNNYIELKIRWAICFFYRNYVGVVNGQPVNTRLPFACESDAYCMYTIYCCRDYSTNPPTIKTDVLPMAHDLIGTIDCDESVIYPEPTQWWVPGWETNCFQLWPCE